jgi:predicted HicB family RNase H-like nuclease
MNDMTLKQRDRAIIGTEDDWGEAEEIRRSPRRQGGAQFSLRIDRSQIEALRHVADAQGISFSDAARNAIREYVSGHDRSVQNVTSRTFTSIRRLTIRGVLR